MKIETPCPQCGGVMILEADPEAGQEIIDKLAACVRCFRCVAGTAIAKPVKTILTQAQMLEEPRRPYAD